MNEIIKTGGQFISSQKADMVSMVDAYIENLSINGGNPTKDLILCTKYLFLATELDKRVREYALKELRTFDYAEYSLDGSVAKEVEVGIKYDFSATKAWVEQKKIVDEATAKLKEIEAFLKPMKAKTTIVDEETGETHEFFPPVRTSSQGVRVTIK